MRVAALPRGEPQVCGRAAPSLWARLGLRPALLGLVVASVCLGGTPAQAAAGDLVLHPTQDARVKSTSPAHNYGIEDSLRTRFGSDGIHYRSYLQFSVSGLVLPPLSARLRLYNSDGSNDGGTLFAVATTFDEKKLTWQNAPACTGTPIAVSGVVKAATWVELDVTSAVRGDGVYDFCLASASSDSAIYSSKEGTQPPELVIEPAPVGCSSNAACSDGVFCNGAEACAAGACVAGTPPSCEDGIDCTGDACDAAANACVHSPSDSLCNDGFFCDGAETCDPSVGCSAAPAGPCAGASCDEAFDVCTQPEAPPTPAEAHSGTALLSSAVFTAADLAAVPGDLYLAAISARPPVAVTGVSGLGLAWSEVATQCGGRNQTGVSLWSAQGVPTGGGPVTATLASSAAASVITVTRYSDVAPGGLGNVAIANTNGLAGACANGVDTTSWMTALDVETPGSTAYAAVALRQRSHAPSGFVERSELHAGSLGNVAGLAVGNATDAPVGTRLLGGSFSGLLDWAAVVAEILPSAGRASAELPPVPVPPENPITERKRVLGKVLFWDEQLSSNDTVACGSCHQPLSGGADPRLATHPGADGSFGTADDVFGSAGVVRLDESGTPVSDAIFGFSPQVTRRSAPVAISALFAPELFVDGSARGAFVDPQSGRTSIASGGALESQAVRPPLNTVEMAHAGRSWAAVATKLAGVPPLARASHLPPDVAAAIAARPTYPQLFQAAFGDTQINSERIAFAIASYERTLVPDQTPWDAFMRGDPAALTARQQEGWEAFRVSLCASCHTPPLFTDNRFHNIGVRPVAEDVGRQAVTGLFEDRGKFRTPTLRNAGLKLRLMHNGGFGSVGEAVAFYLDNRSLQFTENRDPLMPLVDIPPDLELSLVDFLKNGLVDPRVRAESFPFDRPTLSGVSAP